jgi:hypothetical protein
MESGSGPEGDSPANPTSDSEGGNAGRLGWESDPFIALESIDAASYRQDGKWAA